MIAQGYINAYELKDLKNLKKFTSLKKINKYPQRVVMPKERKVHL